MHPTRVIPPPVRYKVGPRPLRMQGGVILQPGDPVPGAEDWPRVDAWVRARKILPV